MGRERGKEGGMKKDEKEGEGEEGGRDGWRRRGKDGGREFQAAKNPNIFTARNLSCQWSVHESIPAVRM